MEKFVTETIKPTLIEMPWKEALPDIHKVNADYAKAIKKLDPPSDFTLIKVSYPWGRHILREGVLQIPNSEGKLVSINDTSIDSKLQKKLNYTENMPMGIVLNKGIYLYINIADRIIPFSTMPPGKIFALWGALQESRTFNYTGRVDNIIAGTNSLVMLPKISDIASFKKIKKEFHLLSEMPKGINDQFHLFQELSSHPDFSEPWSVDVLYFTDKWLEEKKQDNWRLFREFLLNYAWLATAYLRNQFVFDIVFSCTLAEKNLKPNPYLADTSKHLCSVAQKIYPGFKFATDSSLAPIAGFQKIFTDVYGLNYAPTMVHPAYLNDDPLKPIYYSLEIPTLMSFSPKSKKAINKLEDLREIRHIMEKFIDYVIQNKLNLKNTPLYQMTQDISWEFFHSDIDHYGKIKLTDSLNETDNSLQEILNHFDPSPFCNTSPFLRGCIRISKKDKPIE